MVNKSIVTYSNRYRAEIIDLILNIQQVEFNIPIDIDDQPDLKNIPAFYQTGKGNFWIALADNTIIGTIGLLDIGHNTGVLRKMFVSRPFRGKRFAIAEKLLYTALEHAKKEGLTKIYLGTTDRFIAAQKFYLKNGFTTIIKSGLPDFFPLMAVDSVFFKLVL